MSDRPFKSCFLGCGPRAHRHAHGYEYVQSIAMVGAADLDEARARDFAETYGIPQHFTDYRAMLKACRPDIVHSVTQPDFRVEPVRVCAEYGVKAIILEKPMAVNLAAAGEIEAITRETGIKVVVNTQRRYFQSWMDACDVAWKQLGRVRFIHVHCNPAISCIGSHVIDMAQRLLRDVAPESVWATAADGEDFHTNHPGPASVLASIVYPDRINLKLEMSKQAVGVEGCNGFWMGTGIEVIAEGGFLWWTEDMGWGYQRHGEAQAHRFPTNFMTDDIPGQGAFTEAIATWLADPSQPHGNRLETAIRVYRIVCSIIQSAVRARRLPYDEEALVDCFEELRLQLLEREGDHPERVDWQSSRDARKNRA